MAFRRCGRRRPARRRARCSSTSTAGGTASARSTRIENWSVISLTPQAAAALTVDYRLAPEHPHPAAVTDALAAFQWLLEHGIRPDDVVVAGDSAGGGIAVALLLKAKTEGVALPAAAVLLSPWVDLAMTAESLTTRVDVDVRQDPVSTGWCARQFLAGADARDPYASPLYGDLTGLPPLYIQAGDWDVLVDDSLRLAACARAAGVDVRLDQFPEMLHAHQMWAGNMPEADDAVARIGGYVRALRAQPT